MSLEIRLMYIFKITLKKKKYRLVRNKTNSNKIKIMVQKHTKRHCVAKWNTQTTQHGTRQESF